MRMKVNDSTKSSSGTPYCRPHRDRDREIVHQRAESRAFLVHVDEELVQAAVLVLAGAQIDLVAADRSGALAPVGQPPPLTALDHPFDDAFDDALGAERRAPPATARRA